MHYCYVYGGNSNFKFHGWLSSMTIKKLEDKGCTVEILDCQFLSTN